MTKEKRKTITRDRDAYRVEADQLAGDLADTKVLLALTAELADDRLKDVRRYVAALRKLVNHRGLDLDARAIVRAALDHRDGSDADGR